MAAARPQDAAESRGIAIRLDDLAATRSLAARIAAIARTGDLIALRGALGAGKTAFARAFVHARQDAAGVPREEVPSPTFTLVQLYEIPPVPVRHFDLYRLDRPEDVRELGLDEALAEGIALIEWPERLGDLLPAERLDLLLATCGDGEVRTARLVGRDGWEARLRAALAT